MPEIAEEKKRYDLLTAAFTRQMKGHSQTRLEAKLLPALFYNNTDLFDISS